MDSEKRICLVFFQHISVLDCLVIVKLTRGEMLTAHVVVQLGTGGNEIKPKMAGGGQPMTLLSNQNGELKWKRSAIMKRNSNEIERNLEVGGERVRAERRAKDGKRKRKRT